MKNILIFATLIFFNSIAAIGQHDLGEEYKKLDRAIMSNDSIQAEKLLKEIAKKEAAFFLELLQNAQHYNQINLKDSAAFYLDHAITYSKDMPISYLTSEFKATRDSLYVLCISIYDEIITTTPNSIHYTNRANLKSALGLINEAIIDYNISIELDSLSFVTYYDRGHACLLANSLDSAINDFSKCIQLYPFYGPAYLNRGFAFLLKNQYYLALDDFNKAYGNLKNPKERSYALNNIGFTYYKLKKYGLAIEFINESLKLNPINSFAYKNLALIYIALGDNILACKNVQKSISLGFVQEFGNEIIEIQKQFCGQRF